MTAKDVCVELGFAASKILTGVGSAAATVVRLAEFREPEETDLERSARETQEFYDNSPIGDGNYMHVPDGADQASS
jgi:hypothetical protein|tara:strand:- start:8085 stop:8312 length:228 start_codon:yes stop_codon:yes gene_type:complete